MIRIDKNILSQVNIASLGYIIIFPFFIIYHTMIAYNFIPPIFGSLLGYASILILGLFILSLTNLKRVSLSKINIHEIFFFIFYLYCLLWAKLNLIYKGHHDYILMSYNQVIAFLGVFICYYLIGKYIDLRKVKKITDYSLALFFTLILIYFLYTGNVSFMPNRIGESDGVVANYQAFSSIVLIMSLISLASSERFKNKLYICIASIILMFFLSSRSDFIGLLLGISTYFILFTRLKYKLLLLLFIILLIIGLLGINLNLPLLSSNRIFELNELDSSTSWSSRHILTAVAKQQIYESPLMGFFGGQTYHFGLTGAYSHNIYSSWVTFGFIGFLFYLILIVSPLIYIFRWYRINAAMDNRRKLIVISTGIIILFVLVSKSVFWLTPAFIWGLLSNKTENKRSL